MRANLGNADLSPAKLQDADLSAASILKATRRNPSLEPANLGGARLARADSDETAVTRQDGENIVASTPQVPVNAARRQVLVSLLLTGFSRVLKAVLELEEGLPSTPVGDCLRISLCLPIVVGIGWVVGTFFGRSIADMTYCLENHRDAQLPAVDVSRRDLTQMDLSNAELAGADQREADLSGANLVRSDPCDTNLCGASLGAAIPERAHLEGARLKGARLAEAESNNGTIMLEGRDGILASKPGDEPG